MKRHLSMKTISIILLSHFIFFTNLQAQNANSPKQEDSFSPQDSITNYQPSLPVVIGMLSAVFTLTFVLLLYSKFCHLQSPAAAEQTRDRLINPSRPHSSGVEKKVIESLPFFRFSMLKGSREGLDCAVCLSKFDDFEVLRLLPKCKHAFHVNCIDHWLEKHSTCPLCRQKVGVNDLSQMAYSNSFRFLWHQTESRDQESGLEVYVQREEDHSGSSRKEDTLQENKDLEDQNKRTTLHRFNHKIFVSDVIKNRWSNVSPSDIMSLNSEMINDATSSRFGFPGIPTTSDSYKQNHKQSGFDSNTDSKRSMSEIIAHPRCIDQHSSVLETNAEEERMRRLWLPIARKTVTWLANRETNAPRLQGPTNLT